MLDQTGFPYFINDCLCMSGSLGGIEKNIRGQRDACLKQGLIFDDWIAYAKRDMGKEDPARKNIPPLDFGGCIVYS